MIEEYVFTHLLVALYVEALYAVVEALYVEALYDAELCKIDR
jgi:hypothetical protein